MLSNGPSFSSSGSFGNGAPVNGAGALCGERRCTEPWYWRMQLQIQPGAVS